MSFFQSIGLETRDEDEARARSVARRFGDLNEGERLEAAELEALVGELRALRAQPNLGTRRAAEIDQLIDNVTASSGVAGTVLGGLSRAGQALDFLGSGVRSAVNQIQRSPIQVPGVLNAGSFLDPREDGEGASEGFGVDEFLAGLSTGADPVSGRDLLPGILGEGVTEGLPGFAQAGLGFGAEIALDPLTYAGGATLRPLTGTDDAGRLLFGSVGNSSSRLGRKEIANQLADRAQRLGLSREARRRITSIADEHDLTRLVALSRSGDELITPQLLDDLGVEQTFRIAGQSLGSAPVIAGDYLKRAVRRLPLPELAKRPSRLFERLSFGALDRASQLASRTDSWDILNQLDMDNAARWAGTKVQKLQFQAAQATQVADDFFRIHGIDLQEEILKEFGSEEAFRELIERQGRETVDELRQAASHMVALADELGVETAADWGAIGIREGTLSPLQRAMLGEVTVDGEEIPLMTRVLLPHLRELLREADQLGLDGSIGLTTREIFGDPINGDFGLLTRWATTRELSESIAGLSVVNSMATSGQLVGQAGVAPEFAERQIELALGIVTKDTLDSPGKVDYLMSRWGLSQDLDGPLREALEQLNEIEVFRNAFDRRVTQADGPLLYYVDAAVKASTTALETGDFTQVVSRMSRLHNAVRTNLSALATEMDDFRLGLANPAGGSRLGRRLDSIATELDDETLAAIRGLSGVDLLDRAERVMRTALFDPDLAAKARNSAGYLFDAEDQYILGLADFRHGFELEERLQDMVDYAQDFEDWLQSGPVGTFLQGAVGSGSYVTPELAATAVNIHFHQLNQLDQYFGEGWQDMATRAAAEADDLQWADVEQMMHSLRMHTRNRDWLRENSEQFGELVASTVETLRGLRRWSPKEEELEAIYAGFAKGTRLYKSFFTFSGNFYRRNFFGQVMHNFRSGVRTRHYDEWSDAYGVGLRAIEDEIFNGLPTNTSSIWDEIADAGHRARAQQIFGTGQSLASAPAGNLIGRSFEEFEYGLGRRLGQADDFMNRLRARFEQGFTSVSLPMLTSRRVPSRRATRRLGGQGFADFADTAYGIRRATRRELEGYMRGAHLWASLDSGKPFVDALDSMRRTHIDYWDLTPTGQLVDDVLPFNVFQSRMMELAWTTGWQTPGIPAAIYRANSENSRRDPLGAGVRQGYSFGVGEWGGFSMELDPADPLAEGYESLASFAGMLPIPATIDPFAGDATDSYIRNILDRVTPVLEIPGSAGIRMATGRDGPYDDEFRPATEYDGIGPRLAAFLGNSGLGSFIEWTGQFQMIGGEPFLTRNGADFLTNVIPPLAYIDAALLRFDIMAGRVDPYDEEGMLIAKSKRERNSLNGLIRMSGVFPGFLISPEQRAGEARGLRYELVEEQRRLELARILDVSEGPLNWVERQFAGQPFG